MKKARGAKQKIKFEHPSLKAQQQTMKCQLDHLHLEDAKRKKWRELNLRNTTIDRNSKHTVYTTKKKRETALKPT